MKSHTSLVAQQTRLSEWADLIRDCQNRPQGMKIDEWCQLHDITKASYYWRLRKVREAYLQTADHTQTFDVYMKGCMYEGQKMEQRPIGVDTARYMIDVGDRQETYHTGADGYWGDIYEYRHKAGEKSYVDGIEIALTMPEYMSFEKVKASMNYLFEDMCPLPEETAEKKSAKKYQPER